MAAPRVRRWAVRPDTSIWVQCKSCRGHGRVLAEDESIVVCEDCGGKGQKEVPCVSRDAMARALMDGESMLAITGGLLHVVTDRHPTDLPGEAVTTWAVLEWKDGPRATLVEEEASSVLPAQQMAEMQRERAKAHDREVVEAVREGAEVVVEAGSLEASAEPDGFEYGDEEEDVADMEPIR